MYSPTHPHTLGPFALTQVPFGDVSSLEAFFAVASGKRPPMRLALNRSSVGGLIRECWAQDALSRPAVSEVVERLLRLEATHGYPAGVHTRPTAQHIPDEPSEHF